MTEKRYIDKIATNITNEAAKIEMEEQLLQHRLSDIGILRQQVEEERKTERQRKRQEDEEVERFLAKSAIVQSSQRDRFGEISYEREEPGAVSDSSEKGPVPIKSREEETVKIKPMIIVKKRKIGDIAATSNASEIVGTKVSNPPGTKTNAVIIEGDDKTVKRDNSQEAANETKDYRDKIDISSKSVQSLLLEYGDDEDE